MSTIIHMETESVQATAQKLDQTVLDIHQEISALGNSIGSMNWQGGGSDDFFRDFKRLEGSFINLAEQGVLLSRRVKNEVDEWESVDNRGATDMQQVSASGQVGGGLSLSQFAIPLSIVSLFVGLPPWLSSFLTRFLPESNIVSPLVDSESIVSTEQNTTNPPQTKSKLGELMEKAEKERLEKERIENEQLQQKESQKAEETPTPKYIKDYPDREDDGTYLVGQEKSDSCAMASTKMAIERATGVDISESDLRKESNAIDFGYENKTKWGTSPSSLDDLVNNKHSDIAVASYSEPGTQTVGDLEKAASEGKGIVVSVKNSEWFGSENAHSVTVVGVKTENGQQVVLVNDPWPPGVGKRLSIPTAEFEKAWWGDANYISKKVQE